jgi:small GTP-binding protein
MSKGPPPPPLSADLPVIKILLVGDSSVWKSSVIMRFVDDQFSPSFISTIGIDFKIKTVTLPNTGKKVRLQIWDTAGQERFRTITMAYYRGAMAILIVYDITNKQSFSHLPYWLEQVGERVSQTTLPPIRVVVGNKCDLVQQRTVGESEARHFATTQGCLFAEVSACNGRGVETLFLEVTERILDPSREQEQQQQEVTVELVQVVEDGNAEKKKDKTTCC